jgi:hypothetical protein
MPQWWPTFPNQPFLNLTKLSMRPLLRTTINREVDLGGDAMDHDMDHDTSLLTRLKEEARLRQQQHAAASRIANQAMMPQIKMIVSDWYTDEIGNQARIIKALD